MKIKFGKGGTKFGPGVQINLTSEEAATAIYTILMAHNVIIDGPATITINGELIKRCSIYVDPSGRVIDNGTEYSGRGDII